MANNGNLKRCTPQEARIQGAKGGSSPKRKQTLDAKRIMRKLLTTATPQTPSMKAAMRAIGVDMSDDELVTNAGLIAAVMVSQAINGDRDAAKMAFEMSGQLTNAKDIHEEDKIALETRKVELMERETANGSDSEGLPLVIDDI